MSPKVKQISIYCSVAVACLMLGYFAGREHVKYELRAAMQAAADTFKDRMRAALGGGTPAAVSTAQTTPPPTPVATSSEAPPFDVTLVEKSYKPRNIEAHDYQEAITIKLTFKNQTGKDVRAFEGVVRFTDLLDNQIFASKLAINDAVTAGQSIDWAGGVDYNQFMDDHRALMAADQANMKLKFEVTKVLFADGTTKTF